MPSKESGSAVRLWYCCKCGPPFNSPHEYTINAYCSECQRQRCDNCKVEEHFVRNLEGKIGNYVSGLRQAPNSLMSPLVEALHGSALSEGSTTRASSSSALSGPDDNGKDHQTYELNSRDANEALLGRVPEHRASSVGTALRKSIAVDLQRFHQDVQPVLSQPTHSDETVWPAFDNASPINSSASELLDDGPFQWASHAIEAPSWDLGTQYEAQQDLDAALLVHQPVDTSSLEIYGPSSSPFSLCFDAASSTTSVSHLDEFSPLSHASTGYCRPPSPTFHYNNLTPESLHLTKLANTPLRNTSGTACWLMSSCTSVISPESEKHDPRHRLDLNGQAAGEAISPTRNPRKTPDRAQRTTANISPPVEVAIDGTTEHDKSQPVQKTSETRSLSALPPPRPHYHSTLGDSSSWECSCNLDQSETPSFHRATRFAASGEDWPTPVSSVNHRTSNSRTTKHNSGNSDEYSTVVRPGTGPQAVQATLLESQGLACHYHKLNPKKYDACARCSYQDIRSLTQHLKNHFTGRKFPFRVGKERKDKKSPSAKWYDIWDKLFAHYKFARPQSPYADSLQVIQQYNQLIITRLLPEKGTMMSTDDVRRILEGAYPQFRNDSSDNLDHSLFPHTGTST